jgi:hypothetical protein
MNFKQYLKESSLEHQPVTFKMGDDMDTFGKYLQQYPDLNTIVKELAIENDWDVKTFTRVKNLKVPGDNLAGAVNAMQTLDTCLRVVSCSVFMHFGTNDIADMENDTLEFIPDSFQYSLVVIHVNGKVFIIDVSKSFEDVQTLALDSTLNFKMITNKIVWDGTHNINDFTKSILTNGRSDTFKKYKMDIEAFIPFL